MTKIKEPSRVLTFYPDPPNFDQKQAWVAKKPAKSRDAPWFMRKGFYRDESNVVKEGRYIELVFRSEEQLRRFHTMTTLFPRRRLTRAGAMIQLSAGNHATLSSFDLEYLPVEAINEAFSLDQKRSRIYPYHYHYECPELACL
ncbi:hypothetical protein GGS21DRAFT_419809 [Xylaria nigripes]|nr:hypothetical protein GGS21DRAFT_419809 [Xylaria nigripes]